MRAALSDAAGLARRTGADLGRISLSLYPAALGPSADPADPAAGDLTAALRDAAARLPIPTTVTADPPGAGARADLPVRIAVYFVVLEAIQNAAKHTSAGRIDVRITLDGDRLRVTVTDDGAGFDVAAAAPGAGLRHARHRLDDVGGELGIASMPGAGTVLTATVPARSGPAPADPGPGRSDVPPPVR